MPFSSRHLYHRALNRYRRMVSTNFGCQPIQIKLPHPVVSFTFDDFPASAFHIGAPILEKYRVTGTYYTSLGLAGKTGPVGRYFSEADLPELLDRGHELGCHTFDHSHAWNTSSRDYEQSIVRNRERLGIILPQTEFGSHSYPISYPKPRTKTNTAKYFRCARGGGQCSNTRATDANYLAAFFIEKSRDNLPTIKAQIDHANTTSSWLILATHDLCDEPSPFGCTPELFEAIVRHACEVGVPILPVSSAFRLLSQLR
jgi:peptidoglycan/xylan/chitin deacetylase (PgdA/CDA1 family)